jgi:hypothetical protein
VARDLSEADIPRYIILCSSTNILMWEEPQKGPKSVVRRLVAFYVLCFVFGTVSIVAAFLGRSRSGRLTEVVVCGNDFSSSTIKK